MSGRIAALAIALALALAAATCGDDEDPPDRTTSTTESSSSSTTPSPEDEVEAAYLAFAEMGARLLQAPNPDDPEIAQRASGEALGDLVDGLTTLRASNQRYELGPNYGHDVLSVDAQQDTAVAEVCVVDDVSLVNSATGATEGTGITTAWSTVTLIRSGDGWLVDNITENRAEEGVVECQ